jgi:hypothetical protein
MRKTIIKPMELRLVSDPYVIAIMSSGTGEQIEALVRNVPENWNRRSTW